MNEKELKTWIIQKAKFAKDQQNLALRNKHNNCYYFEEGSIYILSLLWNFLGLKKVQFPLDTGYLD